MHGWYQCEQAHQHTVVAKVSATFQIGQAHCDNLGHLINSHHGETG